MKTNSKRLVLGKETLRGLQPAEAAKVEGGVITLLLLAAAVVGTSGAAYAYAAAYDVKPAPNGSHRESCFCVQNSCKDYC